MASGVGTMSPPMPSSRHSEDHQFFDQRPNEQAQNKSSLPYDFPIRSKPTSSSSPHIDTTPRSQRGGGQSSQNTPTSARRPVEPQREHSEVLDRIVLSSPVEDSNREDVHALETVDTNIGPARSSSVPAEPPKKTRQDFSGDKKKETRFGDYILGRTLGEGEFGKVKLGWKLDGSSQVAIKLMRKDNLNGHPGRSSKVHREIQILGKVSHPNIVKLHEMVETERHIGIILEYASGGELFDYILQERHLKEPVAKKLFAQLISAVGYLHKKGIVHRDLKLENLLLDRKKNIMITDFGFANTFDPHDELGEEVESRLLDKDWVKRNGLDRVDKRGVRRGDLMQTSCGSPCYAAPELVVTDALYTGRKVDVWSCGVILYAMLAGYLPFDDDPGNPDGDNINLLYKYIVSVPLTCPDYVTPHARDLLKRILVPDPRKRADLFEVARHSWLVEYEDLVAHITSSTATVDDVKPAVAINDVAEPPYLARSASVREPSKPYVSPVSATGGLTHPTSTVSDLERLKNVSAKDKRNTVQLEYVPPRTETARSPTLPPEDVYGSSAPVANYPVRREARRASIDETGRNVQPQSPTDSFTRPNRQATRPTTFSAVMGPPSRPVRNTSETYIPVSAGGSASRPMTGGSMNAARLPSRGNSYSQPVAPSIAQTTAQGSLAQPKSRGYYHIPSTAPALDQPQYIAEPTRPTASGTPAQFSTASGSGSTSNVAANANAGRSHKRSSTLGNIFAKTGLFGSKPDSPKPEKSEKRYPPTSMKGPISSSDGPGRRSTDSRRPSLNFLRRGSSEQPREKNDRPEKGHQKRFSLIPGALTKALGGNSREQSNSPDDRRRDRRSPNVQPPPQRQDESYEDLERYDRQTYGGYNDVETRYIPTSTSQGQAPSQQGQQGEAVNVIYYNSHPATASQAELYAQAVRAQNAQRQRAQQGHQRYPSGFNEETQAQGRTTPRGKNVLQKPRRFQDEDVNQGGGAARRVMDFFRRRGRG